MSTQHAMTADQLADRTRRAIEAATGAGRQLGLTISEPVVIHDAFSVVVHLAPSPVVARVPVVLPEGFELPAQATRQSRELAAVAWLASRGLRVVRPSPLVPRSPVQLDGFSITFWEYVEVAPNVTPDYVARGPFVAELHATFRDYPAPLPFLAPLAMTIPSGLAYLENNPSLIAASDLDRAKREWAAFAPVFATRGAFSTAFPGATVQALHGDSPGYNVIDTPSGFLHADFEDVTLGPIEWDLTMQSPEAIHTYDEAAMRAGLRRLDHELLAIMNVARMLQVVSCFALVPRFPLLAPGLEATLEQWRAMPFAGGWKG